jgi:hypothetical protein
MKYTAEEIVMSVIAAAKNGGVTNDDAEVIAQDLMDEVGKYRDAAYTVFMSDENIVNIIENGHDISEFEYIGPTTKQGASL